jgi:hypothetical protein
MVWYGGMMLSNNNSQRKKSMRPLIKDFVLPEKIGEVGSVVSSRNKSTISLFCLVLLKHKGPGNGTGT